MIASSNMTQHEMLVDDKGEIAMRYSASSWALRVVVFLVGVGFIYTGIDNAFGGIMTLGWQGLSGFAQATNPDQYLIRDSHVRFLGGVYLLMGVAVALSATQLIKFQSVLRFILIAAFVGGLARFSQMNLSVTFGPGVLVPLLAELAVMPLLYIWLSKVMKQAQA
jgi:hypothetical protein